MKHKRGKGGWMAIKINLEKAFDRLRWEFIEDTLLDIGLPQTMINLIMQRLTSSSMQVLWNGKPSSTFKPQRGIRQGDPLSPLLFILAAEGLNKIIQKGSENTHEKGRLGPINNGQNVINLQQMTHFSFLLLSLNT